MTTARSLAYDVLKRVHTDGAYSHIALSSKLDRAELGSRDRNLATEILYGTLARQRTIDEVLRRFVNRRLDKLDVPVLLTLRIAAYQLLFLDRVPDHAVVHEAVENVKAQMGRGASGFVNGVLRAMLRKKHFWEPWKQIDPEESAVVHLGVRHSLPDWIARRMIEDIGFDEAMEMADSFNARAPLSFRALGEDPSELPEGVEEIPDVPGCYRADHMTDELEDLLERKEWTVQDIGAQLVGHLSSPDEGARILDACAGLGGKAMHLAKLAGPDARVVAVDPQASKLKHLRQTIAGTPLAKQIQPELAKLEDLPQDDQYTGFDLVILDAPCSGLGVIRRHPETRWRRSVEDVRKLGVLQRSLLDEAAQRVRPGGVLVYSVCTFTTEEGPEQIARFLAERSEFQRREVPEALATTGYFDDDGALVVNPRDHDADGFFAVAMVREE